ncbi:MAG TPA: tyrosine-protein phosphatase [Methylomirabilota bacterium]|nr:tyrosine-protein phosphatase [Methylomirabilota bacterium]
MKPILLRAPLRAATSIVASIAAAAYGWAGFLALSGNAHVVIPGELYRSAQLSAPSLETFIEREGIRTVVNLKGARPGKPWYDAERRVAETAGVQLVDFEWRAQDEVPPADVAAFIETMRTLAKPILIHCHAGADRTGLAVALYLAGVTGADEETAEAQLSFWYGHVGLPFTAAWPMDLTFEREEAGLGYQDS